MVAGGEGVVSVCLVGVDYVDGQHVFRIYQWRCHRLSEEDEFAESASCRSTLKVLSVNSGIF